MKRFFIFIFLVLPLFLAYGTEDVKNQAKDYREQGYKLQSMGDIQGAVTYYEKAAQMDPDYAEVYNDLGVLYEAMGDDQAAIEMYKKTLAMVPNYMPAYTNLAFLYEEKQDYDNASYYWKKRYDLGEEGEYWREVARQHLDQLNLYPPFVKARQEKAAAKLVEKLLYEREQERLKLAEEVKLHFDLGAQLFMDGNYAQAQKEFEIAAFLNPEDEVLKAEIEEFITKTEKMQEKRKALNYTEEALNYIKNDDYIPAGEKLKDAFSVVFNISQKE
jgi:Flp pilus assembly protein TadD